MKNFIYQNNLIGKKQLRQILGWSFTTYDCMQACNLADELKYLGFKYATQAGISISLEDLKIPFIKNLMLEKANEEILNSEKIYLKGKINEVERFQKIINTWSLTSEALKNQVINYFKNYDPLNSVYIMAFSGARGNLSQVRQLVGMRGLMSDPSGEIMNLPIKKNFREGLTITDYLMSGYGARKGIIDTALKTANSGYLTRRLIDVAQDILIREKDCNTNHDFLTANFKNNSNQLLGRVLNKPILNPINSEIINFKNTQITSTLIDSINNKKTFQLYIRSSLTCNLYRAVCQQCYGWDLATENLVDIGEAIGILAGQSIGEPGTQLTMRTFHTGGIFTSEVQQQIISPMNGIIQFSKFLETVVLRTNRGEDVLVSKNFGSIILIPENKTQNILKINISRNTILFPKHNQYIQKDTVIGELINTNKQLKLEIKPIEAKTSGEVFIPKLKNQVNSLNNNKLIWLLSGKVFNSPLNSYINFYFDHKLNKNSFIFRTKVISSYPGRIIYIDKNQTLYKHKIYIRNNIYSINNVSLLKLATSIGNSTGLLKSNNFCCFIYASFKKEGIFLKKTRKNHVGYLIKETYKTKTGGILYYDFRLIRQNFISTCKLYFFKDFRKSFKYLKSLQKSKIIKKSKYKRIKNEMMKLVSSPKIIHRTLIWVEEETYNVNCDSTALLVKNGDFIVAGFEIIPDYFSKTSGLVVIEQKNNIVKKIIIQSGLIYKGDEFIEQSKKVYFPGEQIFSDITVLSPSICRLINNKNRNQLLVCDIKLYEIPHVKNNLFIKDKDLYEKDLKFVLHSNIVYPSNQKILFTNSINLILNSLVLKIPYSLIEKLSVKVKQNQNNVEFTTSNQINLNKYIIPKLKYKGLSSLTLVQKNQFIDHYTTINYLESLNYKSLEIVKIKINQNDIKQILLISNDNCTIIQKKELPNKNLNEFILNTDKINDLGKIIIENKNYYIIQKGRPYFFPNCRAENTINQTSLSYKFLPLKRNRKEHQIKKIIFLNYFNRLKISPETDPHNSWKENTKSIYNKNNDNLFLKLKLSKMFLKKNGKFYSCLIPRFIKQFSVDSNSNNFSNEYFFNYKEKKKEDFENYEDYEGYKKKKNYKLYRTLLFQNSETTSNTYNSNKLTLVKFLEYPFMKANKSIGLYSITEDFFEKDSNSVFCQNNQFLENGDILGLLNLEKEITGDIVQGLPRIEEILEARKKNQVTKRIPTSQKKGLLTQTPSLDQNFEFHNIGIPIKENEKINPHKLLKVYFNYYGLLKPFFFDQQKSVRYARLLTNFEGSYKSFKKVQTFILYSVQSVYKSQGVTINNKHLEVIIKQMTTKVLITDEGDTPLLKREIIDLYHIEYINKVIKKEHKHTAYYLPLLFGITRAALNNPSFISAASFQETTRVLTKAAIEGRIDWLRGLKENIIVGHLIPAGTGTRNYKKSFKIPFNNS